MRVYAFGGDYGNPALLQTLHILDAAVQHDKTAVADCR
jgi:hypothetical protein